MTKSMLPISPATYTPHALHGSGQIWTETNCYIDVWVEVLHALGEEPVAAGAVGLSADFEGDQWAFFKFPPEDLRVLYGIEVSEINVYRPIIDHIEEQLDLGRLLTVEVDGWFLPDTAGVSYRTTHTKTTITPQLVDRAAKRLGYFHNAAYFELDGDDFDAVLRQGHYADPAGMPPYVELVNLDRRRNDPDTLVARAEGLATAHLARRPETNPVQRMGARINRDIPWLREQGLDFFHVYAFAMCRQAGASAQLAAAFCDWLAQRTEGDPVVLKEAAQHWHAIAEGTKGLQFSLARLARGRTMSIDGSIEAMAAHWQTAMDLLVKQYGN